MGHSTWSMLLYPHHEPRQDVERERDLNSPIDPNKCCAWPSNFLYRRKKSAGTELIGTHFPRPPHVGEVDLQRVVSALVLRHSVLPRGIH